MASSAKISLVFIFPFAQFIFVLFTITLIPSLHSLYSIVTLKVVSCVWGEGGERRKGVRDGHDNVSRWAMSFYYV